MDARLAEWLWGVGATPPPFANRRVGKRCLVVAPGRGVWDDLRRVDHRAFDAVVGVNYAGLACPHVRFELVASLHPEKGQVIRQLYEQTEGRCPTSLPALHSNDPGEHVDVAWGFRSVRGTSGLFAVKVALAMGFSRVVLAGLPFDGSGYVYWPEDFEPPSHQKYGMASRDRQFWAECAMVAQGRVKSLSGWTGELFGKE